MSRWRGVHRTAVWAAGNCKDLWVKISFDSLIVKPAVSHQRPHVVKPHPAVLFFKSVPGVTALSVGFGQQDVNTFV
jgi:hypothetical protein